MEKAIEGLEWILADDRFGFGVNWKTGEPRDEYEKAGKIITDVIALLKEQEPKPVLSERECETLPNHYERKGFCPKCHQIVEWYLNRAYCGFCGQAVKWDE